MNMVFDSVDCAAVLAALRRRFGASANETVTFGTNWLAQAEHGGYYQAVADGTYTACGLDVTIMRWADRRSAAVR